MTERAAEHTPRLTGRTAASFKPTPTRRTGERVVGGTHSNSFRARLLEHGTRPHRIEPKRSDALSTPEGPRAGADHPGTQPTHAVARAVAETEQALPRIAMRSSDGWRLGSSGSPTGDQAVPPLRSSRPRLVVPALRPACRPPPSQAHRTVRVSPEGPRRRRSPLPAMRPVRDSARSAPPPTRRGRGRARPEQRASTLLDLPPPLTAGHTTRAKTPLSAANAFCEGSPASNSS